MFRKRLNLIYLQIYIIYMFRKRLNSNDGPVTVSGKALCNVSTTSHHNPDAVLNELTRALMFKVDFIIIVVRGGGEMVS